MDLVVFDFDSTLMDGETIEFLAKKAGKEDIVKEITKKAMEGEIDFFESLIKRVKLLKGLKEVEAINICKNLPPIDGIKEAIEIIKKRAIVGCFSGGFDWATESFKEKFDLDFTFANRLHSKNGYLTGLVGGEMMFSDSKGKVLKKLKAILRPKKVVVIGDGANDISMFKEADFKIAFNAKEVLKKEADIVIDKKDLTLVAGVINDYLA